MDQLPPLGRVGDDPHAADVLEVASMPSRSGPRRPGTGGRATRRRERRPNSSTSTGSSSSLQTSQRTGREKRPPSQRIVFENWMPADHVPGRPRAAARPTGVGRLLRGRPQEAVALARARRRHAVLAREPGARLLGRIDLGAALLAAHRPAARPARPARARPAAAAPRARGSRPRSSPASASACRSPAAGSCDSASRQATAGSSSQPTSISRSGIARSGLHRHRGRPASPGARIRRMYACRSVTAIARRASSRLNVCEHFSTWS